MIGIVEDVRYRGLNDVRLDLYLPATQSHNRVHHLMVRTDGDPGVVASVRAAAREIDPNARIAQATAMRSIVDAESAPWRFLARIFVAFAALAAFLAAIGLATVVALSVTARRRELAIRAALGADGARLRALILREASALVALGIALGLLVAIALGRGVAHVLIGVGPHDTAALGAATCIAAAAGALASWLPERRAAAADPLEALPTE